MKKSNLSSLKKILVKLNQKQYQSEAGFTLIELLVVVIMIGVLASIMAPGWQTFMSRQRVNKANDAVLSALQEAQSEAKKTKLSYSVSFNNKDNVPQVAVYRKGTDPNNLPWRDLGQELGLKRDQVILGTNLNGENTTVSQVSYSSITSAPFPTITFDYQGTLLNATSAKLDVVVSAPVSKSGTTPIPILKRCVRVKTLLGAMTIGRGQEDPTNNPEGCP